MKTCPHCSGLIEDDAVNCRHCGRDVPASVAGLVRPRPGEPSSVEGANALPWGTIGLAITAIVVIIALGVGAGIAMRWRNAAAQSDVNATAPPSVTTEPYSFGVRWGTPPAAVSTQLMGRGLSFTEHDEDGDQIYSGVVDGSQAVVIAMFARGGLAKVIVAFQGPADPAAAYAATVKRLTARYGPPSASPATGVRPVASWPPRPDNTGDTRVWVTITDTDDVAIHYESGGWRGESARRPPAGA
jgi:hypothetical protein